MYNQFQVLENVIPNALSQLFVCDSEYPCGIPARPQQPSPLAPLEANFDANGHLTCAVPATSVQFIANLTLTTEQARKIVTSSKNTDVWKRTFINILERGKKKLNLFFTKETA